MFNKKGLSTVVTTLIIILLVLFAIGIIWVVVRGVIQNSGEQISINTKCVSTNIEISNATDNSVIVEKSGGYAIDGIKIVYSNASSSGTPLNETGDIIVSRTYSGLTAGVTTPTKVKVAAYFINENDEEITCPYVSEFTL